MFLRIYFLSSSDQIRTRNFLFVFNVPRRSENTSAFTLYVFQNRILKTLNHPFVGVVVFSDYNKCLRCRIWQRLNSRQ